ncbi:MAG: winged helix-turn-helix domain-containing protein, partial [Pseudomonadota bacterium]|nr:winged helix-turn-helix domain-containing protein [Pseudomonadota bacterium]
MRDGGFQFGDWRVNPSSNSIINGQERRSMEPRAMDVLRALCKEPGTVVSSEHLLDTCWGGAELGDNPVHKTIAQLRRILGDTAAAPRYIETIRKRGYRTVAEVSYADDQSLAPPPWLNSSPFRGLQAFFEDHAAIFFGRRDATARLCNAVCARMDSGMALQLVLGPSGSGKTSLIRAGLLPLLQQPAADAIAPRLCTAIVLDAGEIGEHSLFVALASALLDWEPSDALVFPGESADSLAHRLHDDLAGVIGQVHAALAQAQLAPARLGIFIDRLEALFTLPQLDEAERQRFLDLLGGLARSNCVLVIAACRNDFYPRIAEYPMLMAAKELGGHFDLAAPSPTEIGQIIRMPALAAGLQFGTDPETGRALDDVLCEGAATTADALPLLQYTLQELYRLRSADNTLGFAAFQSLGGVEGAIGHRAEEVVASLDAAQRDALTRVLSLIVTVSPGDDAVTGRRAPWSALTDPAERAVVTTLVDTRLFVSELVGAEPGFGVAHEALLRRWPRVTEWIDAHRNA